MLIRCLVIILGFQISYSSAQAEFIRGDLNHDGNVNNADLLILGHNWLGLGSGKIRRINNPPPVDTSNLGCADKADINDDGVVNLADYNYLSNFLQSGGPTPKIPFPLAGIDPTFDESACGTCFIAGNSGTLGWIKQFHPQDLKPNPGDDVDWRLRDIVTTAGGLTNIQEIAKDDESTLVVLSKNGSGNGVTSHVTVGKTIANINQIMTVHTGVLNDGQNKALGQNVHGLTVDNAGRFIVAEQLDTVNLAAHQVSGLNVMGGIGFVEGLGTSFYPKAIGFNSTGKLAVMNRDDRDDTTINIVDLNAHTNQLRCTYTECVGMDLLVDHIYGYHYVAVDNTSAGNSIDTVRCCREADGFASVILFSNQLPTGGLPLVGVSTFPTAQRELMVIGSSGATGKIFKVNVDGINPCSTAGLQIVSTFVFTQAALAGITDILCLDAD